MNPHPVTVDPPTIPAPGVASSVPARTPPVAASWWEPPTLFGPGPSLRSMLDDGFRVTAKSRACDNELVRRRFGAREETRAFDSRAAAESFAARASERGDVRVEIQAAAPQDPTACDAYVVAIPARNTTRPANPTGEYWRFHTGANQQGALGELLATTPRTNPPAFTWFVRDDLASRDYVPSNPADLVVRVEDAAGPVRNWWPDCRIDASVGGESVESYLCEIKTGGASFQRGQREGMDHAARNGRVLTARVHIERLPDEYEIAVREYTPE